MKEEEEQKESKTDVEGTWNKEPARQEKQPAETKPWWETDASSTTSAAPAVAAKVGTTYSHARISWSYGHIYLLYITGWVPGLIPSLLEFHC